MKHFILDHCEDLIFILNDFFLKGYTRKSKPDFLSHYNKNVFEFACQVYKRGFLNHCHNGVENRTIPVPSILDKCEFERVLHSLSVRDYFFIIDNHLFQKQPELKKIIQGNRHLLYSPEESTKSIQTVIQFIKAIPENTQSLFALGGGITLDIAGFVAGLLNLRLVYLPSTLLASVDAGIGGKTGVNFFPYGKNQVGLFYEAEKLFSVPEYFLSLPFDSIVCGLVEAIKHSWIFGEYHNDSYFISRIYQNQASQKDYAALVEKNILYKSFIVNQDPFESRDLRTALNLGHSLAHVLEALGEEGTIHPLPHGIAVAHGLSFIFTFGLVAMPKNATLISNFIHEITNQYPIKITKKLNQNEIEKYLAQDKKNEFSNLCSLSLPTYGHFSLTNKQSTYLPVTQTFPLNQIANLMSDYISGSS